VVASPHAVYLHSYKTNWIVVKDDNEPHPQLSGDHPQCLLIFCIMRDRLSSGVMGFMH
jgi:hypothetical protein